MEKYRKPRVVHWMCRYLADLTARGILDRERARDQRQHTIHITPTGRAVHDEVKRQIKAAENQLLESALSTEDSAHLRQLLTRLAGACTQEDSGTRARPRRRVDEPDPFP